MPAEALVDREEARARVVQLNSGDSTGGRFALVEMSLEHGAEPPRHRHHNEDEVISVLAGDVVVQIGEEEAVGAARKPIFIPHGVEHGCAVLSAEARLLMTFLPAGFEGFYRETAGVSPEDLDRLVGTAARDGYEVTGSPLRARAKETSD